MATMKYVHVRNLEKYHPGYKDRTLQWAKIHFRMAQGDPDCEMIHNEVDWGRLIKLILLELEAQQPLPNQDSYWRKKGFDVKNRPMSLTLKMIHNFIEPVESVPPREDKDKENKKKRETAPQTDFLETIKANPAYKHIDVDNELAKMDAWLSTRPGRKKSRQFVLNWLNRIEKPIGPAAAKPAAKTVKCPVPGCKEQPMTHAAYMAHKEGCEKRFRIENEGPMDPKVRRLIDIATGKVKPTAEDLAEASAT